MKSLVMYLDLTYYSREVFKRTSELKLKSDFSSKLVCTDLRPKTPT
jgi:hypothetical protein